MIEQLKLVGYGRNSYINQPPAHRHTQTAAFPQLSGVLMYTFFRAGPLLDKVFFPGTFSSWLLGQGLLHSTLCPFPPLEPLSPFLSLVFPLLPGELSEALVQHCGVVFSLMPSLSLELLMGWPLLWKKSSIKLAKKQLIPLTREEVEARGSVQG